MDSGKFVKIITTIVVVGTIIGSIVIYVGGLSGFSYMAHRVGEMNGKRIKCDREFDGKVESIINGTVKVIVKRVSYYIDSMPDYNIAEGQDVTVFAKCSVDNCINHNINYKPVYFWEPIKIKPSCSGDIGMTIILFIVMGLLFPCLALCAIVVVGYFAFTGVLKSDCKDFLQISDCKDFLQNSEVETI